MTLRVLRRTRQLHLARHRLTSVQVLPFRSELNHSLMARNAGSAVRRARQYATVHSLNVLILFHADSQVPRTRRMEAHHRSGHEETG